MNSMCRSTLLLRKTASQRLRLFLLPFAGAGASAFRAWPAALPPDIEIYALGLLRLQQRCVRFAARELKQEAVGDREALERPNAQIVWTGS